MTTTMTTLDTTDIADRARALAGRPVTVYTRDQEWGTVATSGLLGHVHQGVYLTMARDRTDRGLPPELVRVMLSTVEGVHPEAEGAVPAHRLRPGQVMAAGAGAAGPFSNAQVPTEHRYSEEAPGHGER